MNQPASDVLDDMRREVQREHPSWTTEQQREEARRRFNDEYTVQQIKGTFYALKRK
jgi:P2-related tail formation protein